MTGAKYGLVSDDPIMDLPTTQVPERDLTTEKNAAKFSRTKEFKTLKEHLEARIAFYQTFLPDGRTLEQVSDIDDIELGGHWRSANLVIKECRMIIDSYEKAQEVVEGA